MPFRPYRLHNPKVPVHSVTPLDAPYIHTFYDVCPWSPSGRSLVCLRLPFEDRSPLPGDAAEICVIDLQDGSLQTVATTTGWDMQTAAHQVWGETDRFLYFNDKQDGLPVGVEVDLGTGRKRVLDGPIYQVSPDASFALSPCLIRIHATQPGYGVIVAPEHEIRQPAGPTPEDGLWRVDLATGRQSLFLSFAQIYAALGEPDLLSGGTFYGFHVKFNPQGTRILFVVRVLFDDGRRYPMVVTCNSDGSDIRLAVTPQRWARGGHHPNWHPDGERLVINLMDPEGRLRFHEFRYDGSEERVLAPERLGSGHPSYSANGRYLVTDAYPREPVCRDDLVPIRLIDLQSGDETSLCHIWTLGDRRGLLRVDPHPVWSRGGSQLCFVGAPEGTRQLFIADLSALGVSLA